MKKGTQVEWPWQYGKGTDTGVVITDEEDGHVLVAVNSPNSRMRHVLWCEVSKLTEHTYGEL